MTQTYFHNVPYYWSTKLSPIVSFACDEHRNGVSFNKGNHEATIVARQDLNSWNKFVCSQSK